ncbi:glycosyl hydrolase 115 family protein [Adhaeribacter aquaticus]|uniref:glycosyl hydrolase 115 family protein n=1 Tax=Adhaeribacter aquaticus TaxID=299567 RepID=UPI00054DD24A|nr:glycosyl hydrolase 115 family protein [Adhaeribacter aquaticus]
MVPTVKSAFFNKRAAGILFWLLCLSIHGHSQPAQATNKRILEKVNTELSNDPFPASSFLTTEKKQGKFTLIENGKPSNILVSQSDFPGVLKVAGLFQKDLSLVSGQEAQLTVSDNSKAKNLIIVGTLGKSKLIDQLVQQGKIDAAKLKGKWEQFSIVPVSKPMAGVENALVIVGSDKRGTIFGMFELSGKMGVSPWYWWADVPVKVRKNIFVKPGTYTIGEPKVKYRGIFINDEAPALRYWAQEKFGGFNHKFYDKVYELLLRNKANYLWPAMWLPVAFAADDPENARLADEYGIVISTSHHEPMMRAHHEWQRFNGGAWNYKTNKAKLQEFWRGGIERMGNYESVVTMGMRGDGDEGMSEETAVDLLQTIIKDQREILADVTGKPAKETPQVWAIYKEVQDYYDKGMRVDDDITILFSDDNWGNLRYLPKKEDLRRPGGYGMYYHFDYVGAPVSFRWLNVTQIERVWEQMDLTYEAGVKNLWIANVGDIKPMELPTSFFLDMAWNPEAINADDLPNYYVNWAKQQFGNGHAEEIAKILSLYTKYNARRIPEMLKPDTYSLKNYREADRIVEEYRQLLHRSKSIYNQLPQSQKSAFYQLVLSPVEMSNNINEMYVAAGKNKLYAEEGRASANMYAEKVKELFAKDAELTRQFHENLVDGKWNHMMSQTHIGYTSWNHPRANVMPAVSYINTASLPQLGYSIEYGPNPAWGGFSVESDPLFSQGFTAFDPYNQQSFYVDIFNMGEGILNYSIEAKNDWIKLSKREGKVQYDEKIFVSIDWDKAPKENVSGEIIIKGAGKAYAVKVPVRNNLPKASGFVENNGVVSMEAANYTNKIDSKDIHWTIVPNLGRTHSSVIVEPVNVPRQKLQKGSPRLEYEFTVFDAGEITVEAYLSPTQDFKKQDGLQYAISINDEEPQIINMNGGETKPDYEYAAWWTKSVADHIKTRKSKHKIDKPGKQTLKIWMIDSGVVFQKFVIDAGGVKASYLGPPESKFISERKAKK